MSACAQIAPRPVSVNVRIALAAIGFTCVVAQVVLLRELFVAFNGNELSIGIALALWLFWTAIGSALLSRLSSRIAPVMLLASLQVAAAVALPISILLTRSGRTWWNAQPGETLGPIAVSVTAPVALSAFCVVSGWMFAAGARAYSAASQLSAAEGGSATYLLEAVGSAIGGVLASVVLIRVFSSLQIASVVAGVDLLCATVLLIQRRVIRCVVAAGVVLAAAFAAYPVQPLEIRFASMAWPGFRVLAVQNSRYGRLTVVETEGNRSAIENGSTLFTVPDPAAAEEAVHFALLEHPSPQTVLLIGGGLSGSVKQILQHPSVKQVDYVELDPAVHKLAREYFQEQWATIASDPRVHTHQMDGRLFVKNSDQRYDAIIVNLPEPQTAQLNRFYTEEFFREAAEKLAPGGILSFHLRGAEEYISPELADFLRCIRATLGSVFPEIVVIPGETVHFIAARRLGTLSTDAQLLLQRLKQRGIQTQYIREYYLPFRMARERIAEINSQLTATPGARINRDFTPIAYYFDVALWSGQFSTGYRDGFRKAAGVPFGTALITVGLLVACATFLLAGIGPGETRGRTAASYSVAATGLTVMATEILLLLGFQAVYGYVFDELALIIAGFMAGMALGSWIALRRTEATIAVWHRLWIVQVAIALSPLIVTGVLAALSTAGLNRLVSLAARTMFPLLAIGCGYFGGYQFPLATRVFSAASENGAASPGKLYGMDLLGAGMGAVAISAYVLPVFGFVRGALLLLIVNAGAVSLLGLTCFRQRSSARDQRTPAP